MVTEYEHELVAFRWLLFTFYVLIAAISAFYFIRIIYRNLRQKSSKPKWLYVFTFVFAFVRALFNIIPLSVWLKVSKHSFLQFVLDLLPELLAFSTYFLLFTIWVEMYHFSKKMRNSSMVTKRLWMIFIGVNTLVYLAAILMGFFLRHKSFGKIHVHTEAVFLAVLSTALALAFSIYAYRLFTLLSKVQISSNRKGMMIRKLQRLLAACLFCFLIHTFYVLLLDFYFRMRLAKLSFRAAIWFLYFVITEQLPIISVLLFIGSVTQPKQQRPLAETERPVERKPLMHYQDNMET